MFQCMSSASAASSTPFAPVVFGSSSKSSGPRVSCPDHCLAPGSAEASKPP